MVLHGCKRHQARSGSHERLAVVARLGTISLCFALLTIVADNDGGDWMVRYFFDIRDGTGLYPDEEGLEFEDQRAAELEAARTLGELARDLASLDDRHDFAIEVRTEDGPVFKVVFVFETTHLRQ
ncbi:DUF6894 family protein [Bradyrhizobium viridifuturi]|uniref:DUF6894 family protein n=1 Tax=Bradyrhizobium viridifuturi TaxID=1654716 RepID=UPI003221EA3B